MNFKNIPGYVGKYSINMKGTVLENKLRTFLPIYYSKDAFFRKRDRKVKLNGKFELIARLLAITYMEMNPDRPSYYYYIDGDINNTDVNNIRWCYRFVSKGKIKNKYITYLSLIQRESECRTEETI